MINNGKGICRAFGCTVPVTRERLVCLTHWNKIPRELREKIREESKGVWDGYRVNQDHDESPLEYLYSLADQAIEGIYLRDRATPITIKKFEIEPTTTQPKETL